MRKIILYSYFAKLDYLKKYKDGEQHSIHSVMLPFILLFVLCVTIVNIRFGIQFVSNPIFILAGFFGILWVMQKICRHDELYRKIESVYSEFSEDKKLYIKYLAYGTDALSLLLLMAVLNKVREWYLS